MIDERSLNALEYGKITAELARQCSSAFGAERAALFRPLENIQSVHAAYALYQDAVNWMQSEACESADLNLAAVPDIRPMLASLQNALPGRNDSAIKINNVYKSLDCEAFWSLRELLRIALRAHESILSSNAQANWPRLKKLAETSHMAYQLTAALNRCISNDALLRDESSPELYRLREELRKLHQNCLRRVKSYARQYNMTALLQEEFMTISSDRYVLPLKADFKGRMQGIIHDWSQTGETCYFEPIFLVEINNRLQELKREEKQEEQKILHYLRGLLETELPYVLAAQNLLTELDLLKAKQRLAKILDASCITLDATAEGISLLGARHPLLILDRQDDTKNNSSTQRGYSKAEPLDIILRPGERTLVISGGNAGGKTVCLKTLGLIAAMSLSALPVPVANGSHLPWFERIDAFIGDEQSLDDHVSTFTARIEHLGQIWNALDAQTLLLLDEFGEGTDPAEGVALAQALLDELLAKKAHVLAATHFPALKSYALCHPGVRAACMLFDPKSKKPLFKLAYDHVGSSQALEVARNHGFPENILRRANRYLLQDGEDSEKLLERLNALASKREDELAQISLEKKRLKEESERCRAKLAAERKRLQEDLAHKSKELLDAWKKSRISAKEALKCLSGLRAELSQQEDQENCPPQNTLASLVPGQEVWHKVFRKSGLIREIDPRKKRVFLDMRGVSLWAELKDISEKQDPSPKPAIVSPQPAKHSFLSKAESPQTEIHGLSLDLRGKRALEALSEVESFLDKALRASFSEVEIIHGRGTGALRREIHEFLRNFPAVKNFSCAPEDRGGDGMTIVQL